MPVFNVSFLNPALKPSGGSGDGVSVLMNQLTVLQNQLEKDGYLAPSDYELLLDQARKIETTPGLSATEQSRVAVKISEYETKKSTSQFGRADDLDSMNNTMKSEGYEDVLMVGNNPQEFLQGRIASLQGKMDNLQESIARRESTGQDYSDYMNEYQDTMTELQDRYGALDGMTNFDGSNPVGGYAAYVTTNERGEIVDVDYNRYGAKSGFVETNGMINGFQVFAKPNKKEGGNNVFVIGDERFTAPDLMTPDPSNPGSFKPQRLVAQSMQTGDTFKRGEQGYLNLPGEVLQTQSYIPRNTWARGVDGTLYQRMESGGYKKYINATPEDLNIDPARILSIPNQYENGIMRNVTETIDGAEAIRPDQGMDFGNAQGGMPGSTPGFLNGPITGTPPPEPARMGPTREAAAALPQNQGEGQSTQIRNRASAPTERAPSPGNFMLNAARTAQSAFTSIFKR